MPVSPTTDILKMAEERWYKATCRTPRYHTLRFVKAPLECGLAKDAYGCHATSSGLIEISDATPKHLVFQVVTHEMGHSLAPFAGHVRPKMGIMTGGTDDSLPIITAHDISLVCEQYDCPCRNPENP